MRHTFVILAEVDIPDDYDRVYDAQNAVLDHIPHDMGKVKLIGASIVGGLVDAEDVPEESPNTTKALEIIGLPRCMKIVNEKQFGRKGKKP